MGAGAGYKIEFNEMNDLEVVNLEILNRDKIVVKDNVDGFYDHTLKYSNDTGNKFVSHNDPILVKAKVKCNLNGLSATSYMYNGKVDFDVPAFIEIEGKINDDVLVLLKDNQTIDDVIKNVLLDFVDDYVRTRNDVVNFHNVYGGGYCHSTYNGFVFGTNDEDYKNYGYKIECKISDDRTIKFLDDAVIGNNVKYFVKSKDSEIEEEFDTYEKASKFCKEHEDKDMVLQTIAYYPIDKEGSEDIQVLDEEFIEKKLYVNDIKEFLSAVNKKLDSGEYVINEHKQVVENKDFNKGK